MHVHKVISVCILLWLLDVNAKLHVDHSASRAPTIETTGQKEDDTQELPAGIEWNVTCKFNHPINWKAYDAYFDWTPPNINSSSYFLELEMQYVSILTITNTSASSVGRYYCVRSDKIHEHLDEMVTEDMASSIYLYVNDYEQPIVPTKDKSYYPTNDKFIVPCKPSYPDIEVELCNKVKTLNKTCLTGYDPTKGITIPKRSSFIPADGMLYCRCENASYVLHVLPTEDWFGHIYDPDNTAPAVKHISHTCTIFFIPGDRVMVEVINQLTDENEKIELEAPPPEMRYPITVSMTSGNSQTPLNTKDCEVINLQCNLTGKTHSVFNWYKNGVPDGLKKNTSSVLRSQTILSLEGHMRHDDHEVGEYECKKETLYETTQGTPQLDTAKGISKIDTAIHICILGVVVLFIIAMVILYRRCQTRRNRRFELDH